LSRPRAERLNPAAEAEFLTRGSPALEGLAYPPCGEAHSSGLSSYFPSHIFLSGLVVLVSNSFACFTPEWKHLAK